MEFAIAFINNSLDSMGLSLAFIK